MTFPIDHVRASFPALAAGSGARAYFDAPGGTQICRPAIDYMVEHLATGTANSGGAFATSAATDALSAEAHAAVADLLNADPGEIAFGPNMTSLTFAVSRALARSWTAGDEIVVTRLDHDANIAPWLLAARDHGLTIRWLDFDPETGALRLDQLPGLLTDRTKLVAVGHASNALGTLNAIPTIAAIVREHSDALIFVDAVQSVPHVSVDVTTLGADLLVCSPYKFFGPHQGVLWGKAALLESIDAYKVRPSSIMPSAVRFETGTPSFEAQAGVLGTIEYLESLGAGVSRRARLVSAFAAMAAYERTLSERLLDGFGSIPGLKLHGPPTTANRVPTFGITLGVHPDQAAAALAAHDIFAWSGHFYAPEVITRLGLTDTGGLLRVGLCHYNTAEEVDRLIGELGKLSAIIYLTYQPRGLRVSA